MAANPTIASVETPNRFCHHGLINDRGQIDQFTLETIPRISRLTSTNHRLGVGHHTHDDGGLESFLDSTFIAAARAFDRSISVETLALEASLRVLGLCLDGGAVRSRLES